MADNQEFFQLQKERELAKNPDLASKIHELTYLTELDFECKAYIGQLISISESVVHYLKSHSMLTTEWQSFFCNIILNKMHEDTRTNQIAKCKSLVDIIWFLEKRVQILTALEGGVEYFKHLNKK